MVHWFDPVRARNGRRGSVALSVMLGFADLEGNPTLPNLAMVHWFYPVRARNGRRGSAALSVMLGFADRLPPGGGG